MGRFGGVFVVVILDGLGVAVVHTAYTHEDELKIDRNTIVAA